MQTVWQALTGAGGGARSGRRTFQPVRRESRLAGREGQFWQAFNPKDKSRYMVAAERYERATREKGKREGALGSVALEVLRDLLRLIDYRTGRLDPAISTLQRRLTRSRGAIVRALANLRAAGFLDWIRRYTPTGEEGRGVQVQQTSNAYRLFLPAVARALLGKAGEPAPLCEAEAERRKQRHADIEAMIAGLPLWEQPAARGVPDDLAGILSRMGRTIAERESIGQPESSPKLNIYGAA